MVAPHCVSCVPPHPHSSVSPLTHWWWVGGGWWTRWWTGRAHSGWCGHLWARWVAQWHSLAHATVPLHSLWPLSQLLFSLPLVRVCVAEWVCVDVATCMGGAWTWCTSHGGMTTGVARLCHGMVTVQAIATTALVLLCPLSCLPLVCVCVTSLCVSDHHEACLMGVGVVVVGGGLSVGCLASVVPPLARVCVCVRSKWLVHTHTQVHSAPWTG